MNRHELFLILFSAVLLSAAAQSSSAEDINIVDLYSSIDSADVTLHSRAHHTNITIDAELIFEEEMLRKEGFEIKEALPDTDITKVLSWNLKSPEDGFYITRMTLSMEGSVLDTRHYNFSYGSPALPRVLIEDIIPDSRGVSVILSPYRTMFGTQAVLVDLEYMLVSGDTVIYQTTDQRIGLVQAAPLSKDWNVRLLNNHPYSARVKIRIPSARSREAVIARSVDFTAIDDARITELYRDETGASATVLGLSQVPFTGDIIFTVSKDGETIEEIREESPVLMSDDDETIEVIWDSRLPAGTYELSVEVIGNDGDVLDRWETVIDAEVSGYEDVSQAPAPKETPGFGIYQATFAVMLFVCFFQLLLRLASIKRLSQLWSYISSERRGDIECMSYSLP
ncbi:MAG TPA: hypothetical protein EYP67_04550 [Methanosarcinales archaeon]|nr:hypothetical protein [Methanosarcinales archaeon]